MKGWKTWTGAAIMAASAALTYISNSYVDVNPDVSHSLMMLSNSIKEIGFAFLAVGLGHKLEKGELRNVTQVSEE